MRDLPREITVLWDAAGCPFIVGRGSHAEAQAHLRALPEGLRGTILVARMEPALFADGELALEAP